MLCAVTLFKLLYFGSRGPYDLLTNVRTHLEAHLKKALAKELSEKEIRDRSIYLPHLEALGALCASALYRRKRASHIL